MASSLTRHTRFHARSETGMGVYSCRLALRHALRPKRRRPSKSLRDFFRPDPLTPTAMECVVVVDVARLFAE
jgi:hypothetical protein